MESKVWVTMRLIENEFTKEISLWTVIDIYLYMKYDLTKLCATTRTGKTISYQCKCDIG